LAVSLLAVGAAAVDLIVTRLHAMALSSATGASYLRHMCWYKADYLAFQSFEAMA
jgi:hypothetical protein